MINENDHPELPFAKGTLYALMVFLGSFALAFAICALVSGLFFEKTGGRNIHLLGGVTALFIGIATIGMTYRNRIKTGPMVAALGVIELFIMGLIFYYTGSFKVTSLWVSWFFGVNLYIALPWVLISGGAIFYRRTQRAKH